MKIAVIGSSQLSLECALTFEKLGAAVTYFTNNPTNTSDSILIKTNKLTQIHKRFLLKDEVIPNKSRFYDLFRITYEVDPTDSIYSEKLDDDVKEHLKNKLEFFEDFDVVIHHPEHTQIAKPLGCDYFAVGEKNLINSPNLFYQNQWRKDFKLHQQIREMAIVGLNDDVIDFLLEIEDWFFENQNHRLFIVSENQAPIQFLKQKHSQNQKLADFFMKDERRFQERIHTFQQELKKWQTLESYEQAKIPMPQEPIPQLVVFAAHQVTAIDRLIDKNRFFLTIERPDFRECLEQKENGMIDLKTIGTDVVNVFNGYRKNHELVHNLIPNEIGYFELLNPEDISLIKNDLLKRFSAV